MKTIATPRTHTPGWPVSQADQAVLAAVARFGYLTAAQLGRLLYPACHDDYRYARRRLARLADAGLLLRLPGLPTPRYGSTPHVFTLGQAGRQLLGLAHRHLRPSEEQAKAANYLFMDHTLATVDVLVAAERLCRTAPVAMPRLRTERQLRADPLRVELPAGEGRPARSVAVIPDAWFELSVAGRRPGPSPWSWTAARKTRNAGGQGSRAGRLGRRPVPGGLRRSDADHRRGHPGGGPPGHPAGLDRPGVDPPRPAPAGRDLPGHQCRPGGHRPGAAVLQPVLV